jgi:hypothetical protein
VSGWLAWQLLPVIGAIVALFKQLFDTSLRGWHAPIK